MNIFDISCVDCGFVDYSDADFTPEQRANFRCQHCEKQLYEKAKRKCISCGCINKVKEPLRYSEDYLCVPCDRTKNINRETV